MSIASAVVEFVQAVRGTDWSRRVRRPERFTLVRRRITITGTVMGVTVADDGDWHIDLRVEGKDLLRWPNILGPGNFSRQNGYLVVEVEPWQQKTRRPGKAISIPIGMEKDWTFEALERPLRGECIRVQGCIVLDRLHGWHEIHSPTAMTRLPCSSPGSSESFLGVA